MQASVPPALGLVLLLAGTTSPRPGEGLANPTGPEKVEVNLVLIDVVVRDRRDQPVPGLTQDDFELRVDGRPVTPDQIASFEEVCPETRFSRQAPPARPPGSTPLAESASPGHLMIYFDFTQTSFAGRQLALSTARRLVLDRHDRWPPSMIMAFSGGAPDVIQPFTRDTRLIAQRLEDLLRDRATIDLDLVDDLDKLERVDATAMPQRIALARSYAIEERERVRRSLHALEGALGEFQGLSGRKAIVLFTDVMRAEPGVQYLAQADTTPLAQGISLDDEVGALARAANAMGVAFYDVHAGGLQTGNEDAIRWKGPSGMRLASFIRLGIDSAIGLQTTLAMETGGRALHNSNDPGAIVGSAERDLSCYYILGYRYEPHGAGSRHDIKVEVRPHRQGAPRRGLQVRHRPYFVDQPGRPAR